ncbi:MAG: substrate-binding domain-containing protein, partial [Candidatus Onthovivens sp.]|nr:substrate-binding domain-containing protein [Candidatus Onthovivens sp.]MDY6058617.1 substrate-binding domain-containing protein [Candidatus Onthovivens sp.]
EVLSIIGTKYSSILRPQISSMNVNFYEVGKRAVDMLVDLINGDLNDKTYKFESKYVKRESTKF